MNEGRNEWCSDWAEIRRVKRNFPGKGDGKEKAHWSKLWWELGSKRRTQETDYFRDQGTKQLMNAVTFTMVTIGKSNSFWSFSFTLLFFGVVKISSVLSFKAVRWQWIDTKDMGTVLSSIFLLWGLWWVCECLLSRTASIDAGLQGFSSGVLLSYIN